MGPGAKQVFRLLEWNVDGELLGHGEDVAKRSRYRQVATIAVALTYVPLGGRLPVALHSPRFQYSK